MAIRGLLSVLWLLLLAASVHAEVLSQRDWMEQLTDSLGWGYGLPDEPETDDYIALLSGKRHLIIEAEDNHRRSDRVAVKRLTNYGAYSGSGWVSGQRQPVQLHLDVLIPHNGRYRMFAATRLPGVKFALAGQELVADGGSEFRRQELGMVNLPAGPLEIVVSLPPDAGIDYLLLSASPRPPIAPLDGWQPDADLQTVDLAITMLQALDLLSVVPLSGHEELVEAEAAAAQSGVSVTTDRHLGAPSGGRWVRAGYTGADWIFPVPVKRSGCYQLSLRGSGEGAVTIAADGVLTKRFEFNQAMQSVSLGRYCLPQGQYAFKLQLPPRVGIDSLSMQKLDTEASSLVQLLGVAVEADLQTQLVNELLQILSSLTY